MYIHNVIFHIRFFRFTNVSFNTVMSYFISLYSFRLFESELCICNSYLLTLLRRLKHLHSSPRDRTASGLRNVISTLNKLKDPI